MADFALRRESIEEMLDYNVLHTKFENGTEQRRLKQSNALIGFKITSPLMNFATMTTYRNFLVSKYGSLTSFTFDSPFDNTTYTVRFEPDSWKCKLDRGLYRATFSFKRLVT